MSQPTLKNWIIATRPWSFPASSMPALIAISWAFYLFNGTETGVNWLFGIAALIGATLFQASGNLIGDYFDFKHGVDRKDSFGSSRMLVDEVFTPKTVLYFGIVLLAAGSLLGIFFLTQRGLPLLWIGLTGVLCTFFYYKLKYIALGDAVIFLIYGQLIALGTFYVMTGFIDWRILLVSAPTGFLVVNILHANNTRDIFHDSRAEIKTMAMLLGEKGSKIQYALLAVSAYLMIAGLAFYGTLPLLSLIVFISVPLTVKNIKQMQSAEILSPEKISALDGESAKAVMAFSILLALSNFIGTMV